MTAKYWPYFTVCTAQFLVWDSPKRLCQLRRGCHFDCVTLLSGWSRGELAQGALAMTRMPLTTAVLLIMASRLEAGQTLTPMLRHALAQTDAAEYAHTHTKQMDTHTHTLPHLRLFSILPLSYNSSVWYDRLLP